MENSKLKTKNIIQDFQINYYEFHCPECLQNALFGIKNKKNKIYIKYKCRKGHNGEILIENFIKTQNNSINNLSCYNCGNLKDIYYCFECSNSFCEKCKSKHLEKNHNKIFKKEDYNKICPKHFKYYKVYCETCKLLLCEDCPSFHVKHELSKKSINYEKELNNFKDKIEKDFLELEIKLKEFINKIQIQLQFIKSIMNSYNNKNNKFFNYERYLNLKNLKIKKINLFEINKFLNNEYNIIDEYDININDIIEDEGINEK